MIARTVLGLSFVGAAALVAGACSSNPPVADQIVCVDGETEDCACDGGGTGSRTCVEGTGFTGCDCSGESTGDGGGVNGGGNGAANGGQADGAAGNGGDAAAGDGATADAAAGDGGESDASATDGGMDASVAPDSSAGDAGPVCEGAAEDPTMDPTCDACLREQCCDEMVACASDACSTIDDAGLTEAECVAGCLFLESGDGGTVQDAVSLCTPYCSSSGGPVSAATEALTQCLIGGDAGPGCQTECGL